MGCLSNSTGACMAVRLLQGDCRETLKTLDAGSVQCCVTSPPYFGLRDYQTPPLVWGGIEHEHEWDTETVEIDNRTTVNLHRRNGGPAAGAWDQPRSGTAQRAFCACGAWLGSLGLE